MLINLVKNFEYDEFGFNYKISAIDINSSDILIEKTNYIHYDKIILSDFKEMIKMDEKAILSSLINKEIRVVKYLESDDWISQSPEKIKKYNLDEINNLDLFFELYNELNFLKTKLIKFQKIYTNNQNEINLFNKNGCYSDIWYLMKNKIDYLINQNKFDESELVLSEFETLIKKDLELIKNEGLEFNDSSSVYFNIINFNPVFVEEFISNYKKIITNERKEYDLFLLRNPEYKELIDLKFDLINIVKSNNLLDSSSLHLMKKEDLILLGNKISKFCDNYTVFFNISYYKNNEVNHSMINYGEISTAPNILNYNLTNILLQIDNKLLLYFKRISKIKNKDELLAEIEENILVFNKTKIIEIYTCLVSILDLLRYLVYKK